MQKNENFNVKNLTRMGLIAAMYVALTLLVKPLAFGGIQFRVSEVLVLLCFYRRDYAPALIVGCLIANLFSPYGLYDIIWGTFATALATVPMHRMPNLFIAALLPIFSNGIIVGIEITVLEGKTVWYNMATVALGELAVMIVGVAAFKLIFDRNRFMLRLIGSERGKKSA